ncbi:cytochrome P450 [Marasmius fiardii PR-910]|nr:cytochrome P450 [Marasmius fiardii PR-910]
MIHFKVIGQHMIVLNSRELAERMLERCSGVYSDRPSFPVLEVTGWTKLNTAVLKYGQDWRVHRRLYQQGFRENVIQNYRPVITSKVGQVLSSLRQSPDLFEAHIRTWVWYAAATILTTVYGYDVTPSNDQLVHIAEEAIKTASDVTSPAMMVVNVFYPFLRYLPVDYPIFKFQHILQIPYEFVKKDIICNTNAGDECWYSFKQETSKGKPVLLAMLLKDHATNGGDEYQGELIRDVVTTVYAGELTSIVLLNFCLVLALHPECQKRAQLEIETVAILRETLHWSPPFPLSIFHAAYVDDTTDGYYIPKGTVVTSNIWAMTRDESIYPDPELSVPERFLSDTGMLNDDKMLLPFGFGRRICAGQHFAIPTLWTAMALILSQFHISQPKDMMGQPITKLADLNYSDGLTSIPDHFHCMIKPQLE